MEMLAVVMIIAIMVALLAPSLQGILGAAGPRGGLNVVSAALEQARLSAMESGVPAYVGFAEDDLIEPVTAAGIVFREPRDDETNTLVPVSRWLKLPRGVFYQSDDLTSLPVTAGSLPKLGQQSLSDVEIMKFDRFGRLDAVSEVSRVSVGRKAESTGEFLEKGGEVFYLDIQPLTGRVLIAERSQEEAP